MNPVANVLLAALPRRAYLKLLPALSPVTLVFGDSLYEQGDRMEHVFFPEQCLVSLLSVVDKHLPLEVGMVGREGMVGIAIALGIDISPMRVLVQGGGPALRMKRAGFRRALLSVPELQRGVNRYTLGLLQQVAQTAACNQFHAIGARLARWLLMSRDRMGSDEFPMKQEFLSSMLGVRRAGVTQAASAMQRGGLIEYSRGQMRVLQPRGLEKVSCSCYVAIAPVHA